MRTLALTPIFLILTACGSMGGADYRYTSIQQDGSSCSIEVGSTRSLQGVNLMIDEHCQLQAQAEAATANKELSQAINKLVDKLPAFQ